VTVLVGLLGAVGAIMTDLVDWSDTYGSERRVGLNHALFNAIATILYVVSFVLRLLAGPGDGILASIIGLVGLVSVLYAAYLGGGMVFVKGTAVNRTACFPGGKDYEAVMPLANIEENQFYPVTASGVLVVLLRQGELVHALAAGPLDEETLQGDIVECPWHRSRFCMRDGRVLTGPATVNAPRYDVRVRNGQVEVKRRSGH
jgi:nitrite reductase/ring-hydroxylating ferredoxin subunit